MITGELNTKKYPNEILQYRWLKIIFQSKQNVKIMMNLFLIIMSINFVIFNYWNT